MRELTELEQEEVMSHYVSDDGRAGGGLVGWFITKYRLDYDEWHGDVCSYLIRAVQTHDSSKGALSTYFHTIARNAMVSEFRKQRDLLSFDDDLDSTLLYSNTEDYSSIYYSELIDQLDDRSRQVCYLLIDGYNQTEIASIIGLTPRTIRTEVSNLRGTLREMMR